MSKSDELLADINTIKEQDTICREMIKLNHTMREELLKQYNAACKEEGIKPS